MATDRLLRAIVGHHSEAAGRKLAQCRALLGMAPVGPSAVEPIAGYHDRYERLTGHSLRECPHCHTGIMVVVDCIPRRIPCQRWDTS